MNFKFYIIIKCFLSLFIVSCKNSNDQHDLGSIAIKSGVESVLAVNVPISNKQPWRLKFDAEEAEIKKGSTDKISIKLHNNNSYPITIYLLSLEKDLVIQPSMEEVIFDGTLEEMILLGRTEYEDMTIVSSTKEKVNINLKFSKKSGSDTSPIVVSIWRINYGF